MNHDRQDFGTRLKEQRRARELSLADIARITKIPSRSLERLEGGEFDDLPGDVFVRGFLRSYARCVGMDPEDTVRRYGELVSTDDPKGTAAGREAGAEDAAAEAPAPVTPAQELSLISKALSEAGTGTRRMTLTLAVIILVIVATLTLSLLLRRPGRVGSGVSQAEVAAETLLA